GNDSTGRSVSTAWGGASYEGSYLSSQESSQSRSSPSPPSHTCRPDPRPGGKRPALLRRRQTSEAAGAPAAPTGRNSAPANAPAAPAGRNRRRIASISPDERGAGADPGHGHRRRWADRLRAALPHRVRPDVRPRPADRPAHARDRAGD